MQACQLSITTTVDGQETKIDRLGKIDFSNSEVVLSYCEENAKVHLRIANGQVFIERLGDYSLCLHLYEGTTTKGTLGFSGTEGEIEVKTTRVGYSIGKDSVLLRLQYDLLFGAETQTMKLRLLARVMDNKGEGEYVN